MLRKIAVFLVSFALLLPVFPGYGALAAPPEALRGVLNAAPLSPQRTGYLDMDNKVAALLGEFGKTAPDTYSLVKACYDYLVLNTSLRKDGDNIAITGYTKNDKDPGYDSIIPQETVFLAAGALYDGKGICHEYAAAFIVLTRAIGLESYFYTGQAAAPDGYMGHAWAEVKLDGKYYIFDPNLEARVIDARGGGISYNYFGRAEDEMQKEYIWDRAEIERYKKEFAVRSAREQTLIPEGLLYVYNINPAGLKKAAVRNSAAKTGMVRVNYNGKGYASLDLLRTQLPPEVYYFTGEFVAQVEIDPAKDEIILTFDKEAGVVGLGLGKRGGS